MNITSINIGGYRCVNFGDARFFCPPNAEKDNSSKAVAAVDEALSLNTGLEMLGLINTATMLAKKNGISIENEFSKIRSNLSATQEMKDNEDFQLVAKILDTRFNKGDKYKEQINRQTANIINDIAFISDFIESEKFIKFVDQANKERPNGDARINKPYQSIDIEFDGIKGTLHTKEYSGDYITIPETDDRPGFCYYFPNFSQTHIEITRRLSDNEREIYTYPIHNQERKLHNSYAVKVQCYLPSKDYMSRKTICSSYAWNKDNNDISVYCTDIKAAD